MSTLKLPIGLSDFRQIIQEKYYFIDKSLFIQEILEDCASVLLIARPRRFGKTLNLSMLRYFLAKEVDDQTTQGLFDGLKIQQADESIRQYQGKYPVIFLTFEDLKFNTFEETYRNFCELIASLYKEHRYLLTSDALAPYEKEKYQSVIDKQAGPADLSYSIKTLSTYLYRYHGLASFILIDECDTPIQSGYLNGYYPEIVELLLNFLGEGLKDNPHCFKGVLTGIFRTPKESFLFSGLNNLILYSVLDKYYGQYFGFTEEEVHRLLEQAHLTDQSQAIHRWYDGYQIGKYTVYNPWSLLNCVNEHGALKHYWLNTSDNALIKQCLYGSGLIHKEVLEYLINDQTITSIIDEHMGFSDLKNLYDDSIILSFLLMTGYLKVISTEYTGLGKPQCQLAIPNHEIKALYVKLIRSWLTEGQDQFRLDELLNQLLTGKLVAFETSFRTLLENVISVHDLAKEPEAFYYGFMVGLTAHIQVFYPDEYELKSYRESGYDRGWYDYLILSHISDYPSLLIEFKRLKLETKRSIKQIDVALGQLAYETLSQIDSKGYDAEIKQLKHRKMIKIAIAFCGKQFKLAYKNY
jgi:Predicted AAA-ATPase/PD-(D/E)XK nuclease superfamily